ncbi:CRTAC1 family protein [uncultured Aquimarina sp.]|uniref:CRTAC1 family protein n=1 Tax=uncultured Aquimarina sp. TaxID=575652 RepID=UPI00262C1D26|nr:CRTAC1 family protein [uncultured Aquimarina sp.]
MDLEILYRVYLVRIILLLFVSTCCISQSKKDESEIVFSENENIISLENRNRRKFDNAVIADLDQDGFLDLLLTDHSRRVELFWNNKGVFEKGDPFIFGDTHGIAVADYNMDGIMDVIVQPGGGGGKKPRKVKVFQVQKNRKIFGGDAFEHFEGGSGRAAKLIDYDLDGKLDLITSVFPHKDKLERANVLYQANDEKGFNFIEHLPYGNRFDTRISLIDFNTDNTKDFLAHGRKNVTAVQSQQTGGFKNVSETIIPDFMNLSNVNSVSQIDIDNDGDFDLFLTRSKEPFGIESDYNEEKKTFYFFARTKAIKYDDLEIEGDFFIENLQMSFPDFRIFMGAKKKEWTRTLDKHGHHDVKIQKEEAEGFPEDISEKGLYIGYVGSNMWRIGGFTKSPTSGVIHNVMKAPKIIELKSMPAKLLENRGGIFVDVTSAQGIDIKGQTSSSAVGDFNNDGWSDIFVLRFGNPAVETKQILLINNKGKGYSRADNHGIITTELGATGMGADAFDYDKDGDLDIIFANERGKWHLFTNNYNSISDKYVLINVGYSPSGKATAMGAVLTINACGNTYKRIVGETSSSYSHSFNTQLHVGLGACEKIESATVLWSNGEQANVFINKLNKRYTIGTSKIN